MSKSLDYALIDVIDFGKVDSESEPDLDKRFVRTEDFDQFIADGNWVILGPKGTGKSAIFELFTKHEKVARALSGTALDDTIITAGTGFGDLSEIATGDIKELRDHQDKYEHEKLWTLYIAVRAALGVVELRRSSRGPLKRLLRALGRAKDFRILPLLKELWQMVLGDAPSQVSISSHGATITLKNGRSSFDVVALLEQVQAVLEKNNKTLWILFDKIDELWSTDHDERLRALEALISTSMGIRRRFPAIQPRVFLRTDIWQEMNFTNKSHLLDKKVELSWSREQLTTLILKRACAEPQVKLAIANCLSIDPAFRVEELTAAMRSEAINLVFPASAYPGSNEAKIMDWMEQRITDGRGTVLPREAIRLANIARDMQRSGGSKVSLSKSLFSRESMRSAFTQLSRERCQSFLAEFPELTLSLQQFRGQTTATFSRRDILRLLDIGSKAHDAPDPEQVLYRLCEIGVLGHSGSDARTAETFEVPRLYRVGLGLTIRGRA